MALALAVTTTSPRPVALLPLIDARPLAARRCHPPPQRHPPPLDHCPRLGPRAHPRRADPLSRWSVSTPPRPLPPLTGDAQPARPPCPPLTMACHPQKASRMKMRCSSPLAKSSVLSSSMSADLHGAMSSCPPLRTWRPLRSPSCATRYAPFGPVSLAWLTLASF